MVTGEPKNDPNYVEWFGVIQENNGTHEYMVQKIGVHNCTKEDMDKFYPPSK